MRSPARSNRAKARDDDDTVDRKMPRVFILRTLGWSHRDAVGCIVGAGATIVVLVNVLFLQSGPHPAPMLKTGIVQTASVGAAAGTTPNATPTVPRPRPLELATARTETPAPAAMPARAPAEVVTDIQRELSRRGFYEGAVDGRYGPRTDTAIRDFEHAAGLKPSSEPGEALLRAIRGSNVRGKRPAGRTAVPVRNDPIAAILKISDSSLADGASLERVRGVQRALAEYGYGQIDPTGVVDTETQVAIAKFERARSLPVTGQVTDRVARELASLTGRPLE